jgi:hypothetical protein
VIIRKDATRNGITEEYCKDVDIHGITDNHPPPLFEYYPKEDQLQLNPKEVSADCCDCNGLNLAPHCPDSCFLRKEEYDHKKAHVQLNNLGNYVHFLSRCYHQGYYHDRIVITAQLFARPSIHPDSEGLPRLFVQNQD